MPDTINLRTVRKQKARAEKEQRSAQNRALHGRTRSERELDKARTARLISSLDAHRLDASSRRGEE